MSGQVASHTKSLRIGIYYNGRLVCDFFMINVTICFVEVDCSHFATWNATICFVDVDCIYN